MKKALIYLSVLLLFLASCASNSENKNNQQSLNNLTGIEKDRVIATVNGEAIKGEVYNALYKQIYNQYENIGQNPNSDISTKQIKDFAINELVKYTVVFQKAKNQNVQISDEEIEKQIEEIKTLFKNEQDFKKSLDENNLTINEMKKQIEKKIKYEHYLKENIMITPVIEDEIKEYYNTMKNRLNQREIPEYKEIKNQIKQEIEMERKQKKIQEEIKKLKKEGKIKIHI